MRKPTLSPTASKGRKDGIHGNTRFGLNTGPTSAVNIRLSLAGDEVVRPESPVQHCENAREAYARPMRSLCEAHANNALSVPYHHPGNALVTHLMQACWSGIGPSAKRCRTPCPGCMNPQRCLLGRRRDEHLEGRGVASALGLVPSTASRAIIRANLRVPDVEAATVFGG